MALLNSSMNWNEVSIHTRSNSYPDSAMPFWIDEWDLAGTFLLQQVGSLHTIPPAHFAGSRLPLPAHSSKQGEGEPDQRPALHLGGDSG